MAHTPEFEFDVDPESPASTSNCGIDMSPTSRLTLFAAIAHTLLAVLILVGIFEYDGWDKGSRALYDLWPTWSNGTISPTLRTVVPDSATDSNITFMVLLACAITALFHWAAFATEWNIADVNGIKWPFWLEYSFTASLIASIVTLYSGYIDIKSQILVLILVASQMMLGMLQDVLRATQMRHIVPPRVIRRSRAVAISVAAYIVGFLGVVAVWAPSLERLADSSNGAPDFVWPLAIAQTALYLSFGIAQLYYHYTWMDCKGTLPDKSHLVSEHNTFIILSIASKATLAIMYASSVLFVD